MAELKTQKTNASVLDFINAVDDEAKRQDSLALLKIFEDCIGEKPVMWGSSMIGFGQYHYKSERSSQEGDWPVAAFSPRKQNLTVYVFPGFERYAKQLADFGKYKASKGCLYFKRLSDIDVDTLKFLIKDSAKRVKQLYPDN
jgi:hypothetical protein